MKNILPILVAASLFSACAPTYVPTMVHTPLFKEQGDFSGSISTGINNIEGHVAGAITNNFALMVSGSKTNFRSETGENRRKGHSFEIAPGFYTQLNNRKKSVTIAEVFAGYGQGYVQSAGTSIFGTRLITSEGHFSKYFIQPGIGMHSPIADIGLHLRYTGIYFNELKKENGDILYNSYNGFIEPVVTVRVGFEYGKIVLQQGFSFALKEPGYYTYNPFLFNLGIFLDIRKSYYKKKETVSP